MVDGSNVAADTAALVLNGGNRSDVLVGGDGNETLDGGAGDDTFIGGEVVLDGLVADRPGSRPTRGS